MAGEATERLEIVGKTGDGGVDDGVGPEGGDDAALPAAVADLAVVAITSMLKRSKRARGRNSGVFSAASMVS